MSEHSERGPSGPRRAEKGTRALLYDWECEHVLGRTDHDLPWLIAVANATGGPVLELACGTGRVSVPLATTSYYFASIDELVEEALRTFVAERVAEMEALAERMSGQGISPDEAATLFGELAPGHEPRARARRLVLFALQVAGVPDLYVEEALWMCSAALEST